MIGVGSYIFRGSNGGTGLFGGDSSKDDENMMMGEFVTRKNSKDSVKDSFLRYFSPSYVCSAFFSGLVGLFSHIPGACMGII